MRVLHKLSTGLYYFWLTLSKYLFVTLFFIAEGARGGEQGFLFVYLFKVKARHLRVAVHYYIRVREVACKHATVGGSFKAQPQRLPKV